MSYFEEWKQVYYAVLSGSVNLKYGMTVAEIVSYARQVADMSMREFESRRPDTERCIPIAEEMEYK